MVQTRITKITTLSLRFTALAALSAGALTPLPATAQVTQTRSHSVSDASGRQDSTIVIAAPTGGGVLYYRSGSGTALVRGRPATRTPAPQAASDAPSTARFEPSPDRERSDRISRLDLLEMENRILSALNRRMGESATSRSGEPLFFPQSAAPIVIMMPNGQRLSIGEETVPVAQVSRPDGQRVAERPIRIGTGRIDTVRIDRVRIDTVRIDRGPIESVRIDTVRIEAPGRPIFVRGPERVTVEEVERAILDTGLFRTSRVQFEFAKAAILPTAVHVLDAVAQVLLRYPDLRISIHGHTDSRGSDATNDRLSRERANSVRSFLLASYPSIDASRIESEGFGERQPVATNDTETGRALNRRVEFIPLNPAAGVRTISRTGREE